jgi:hypothetical protein
MWVCAKDTTYPFICDVACSHGGKETSKVGKAVRETHEDASKAWWDVQMVHFESWVDATIETHTNCK